jgi:hypothetical protein
MSFACHIWEFPAPADSFELELIREAYYDVRTAQNPRYLELAKRLTAKHPCIMTLADEDEELGVWSDGPLDGITQDAIYGLGIRTDYLDTVYPFVCDTANDLGLNVYDDVANTIYRADGAVIDYDPDAGADRFSRDGLNLTKIGQMLGAQFADVAAARGYRKVGYHPVRAIEGGWQAFAVRVREVEGMVMADAVVETYLYDVMRLVHALDPERRAGNSAGRTFVLSSYEFFEDPRTRLVVREPGDFLAVARKLRPIVEKGVLPLADECRTLASLDAVMNTSRTKLRHFPLNHLVVARLAGNPAFEALYERMREVGYIDDDLHPWLSATRERLAMRLASR